MEKTTDMRQFEFVQTMLRDENAIAVYLKIQQLQMLLLFKLATISFLTQIYPKDIFACFFVEDINFGFTGITNQKKKKKKVISL